MEGITKVIDKGTAISIGVAITLITIVFAAGMLFSQVQRNTNDIAAINAQLDVIQTSAQTTAERLTSIETKMDILIQR